MTETTTPHDEPLTTPHDEWNLSNIDSTDLAARATRDCACDCEGNCDREREGDHEPAPNFAALYERNLRAKLTLETANTSLAAENLRLRDQISQLEKRLSMADERDLETERAHFERTSDTLRLEISQLADANRGLSATIARHVNLYDALCRDHNRTVAAYRSLLSHQTLFSRIVWRIKRERAIKRELARTSSL